MEHESPLENTRKFQGTEELGTDLLWLRGNWEVTKVPNHPSIWAWHSLWLLDLLSISHILLLSFSCSWISLSIVSWCYYSILLSAIFDLLCSKVHFIHFMCQNQNHLNKVLTLIMVRKCMILKPVTKSEWQTIPAKLSKGLRIKKCLFCGLR